MGSGGADPHLDTSDALASSDQALGLRDRYRAGPPGLTETTRLCDVAHNTAFPRVSPDGSRIAFITTDEGRRPPGLYVADLQACRLGRFSESEGAPQPPPGRTGLYHLAILYPSRRELARAFKRLSDHGVRVVGTGPRSRGIAAPCYRIANGRLADAISLLSQVDGVVVAASANSTRGDDARSTGTRSRCSGRIPRHHAETGSAAERRPIEHPVCLRFRYRG